MPLEGIIIKTVCIFYSAMINIDSLIVQGSDFQFDGLGPQVELGKGNLTKAVVMGNVMRVSQYMY